MSAVKAWGLDVQEAQERGRAAAGTADLCARMGAFRDLCAELGEVANGYACPLTAARALVGEAARAFVAELKGVGA
ncbi:hypothetical protein AB5J55_22370 [Streptomyces sp. R11]|uniref:Uncharacterized protein n=1 Tax=Streptomyces sp. R11 TaxID=3238625 RepID=A0AB39N2F2_9ACTN